ncbi:hypothetical protein PYW08_010279 [Mythimna loreyi]|uniref:Uncharacterized protein n=1 Tax=Mythimna loreyi TaxID=667449 RepID=A0ACC2Q4B6_9NEOP|nr:hypothetical protein PYW08_010279 [Mythimna loreyi]
MWLLTLMAAAQCALLCAQLAPARQQAPPAAPARHQAPVENLKTASKHLEFVNKMREDLRRNNDDYELLEGQNQLEEPPLPAHPAPRQPSRKWLPNRLLPAEQASWPQHDARRGKGDLNQEVVIQGHKKKDDLNQGDVNQVGVNQGDVKQGDVNNGDVKQGAKLQGDATQANQSHTEFRSFSQAKRVKSLRVNKLKKLLQRDKDKLQDTTLNEAEDLNSFTLQTTTPVRLASPAPPPPPPPRRTRFPRPSDILRNAQLREKKHSLHKKVARQGPPVEEDMGMEGLLAEEEKEEYIPRPEDMLKASPPSREVVVLERRPVRNPAPLPDQIDMAHARNPLITRIRLKGRLCQRSLMNMEGPTYDREGKQVLPEHDPRQARGRLFHQTRAPELVLPKCCNCCKKSVLGCQ